MATTTATPQYKNCKKQLKKYRQKHGENKQIPLVSNRKKHPSFRTPRVGFEPTTNRLTADRSTTEIGRAHV